ncbi:hypothetical protein [Chamaesiphon sp. VAR_48_metabat_135_sub]|uniref:hypothetical protein n=1 Tax=Chamaesiphon sp. VAR_48_metabat_135_sub TaxID=2964699 RepID=UPI00286C5233|nr:hypothetical protein [Chamaesiphon sp. VAR_48_metabat_135_sub]
MIKLNAIGFVAVVVAMTSCFATQAQAQSAPDAIGDTITKALFNKSGDIYRNTGIDRQAVLFFGLSYPDHEALADTQSVDKIYKDAIRQRGSEPVITRDLPNPFNSSLLSSPPKN